MSWPRRFLVAAPMFVLAAILSSISGAVDGGSADPEFGSGTGKVAIDLGADDVARGVAVQPDGKIVAVGDTLTTAANADIIVMRVTVDGTPDSSFAGGKALQLDFGKEDRVYAVALQPDGKIVVAGTALASFVVVRLLPNGSLDSSFGSGGFVLTKLGVGDRAFGVALQTDGKIVAAGITHARNGAIDFAVARYLPNGALDGGFGSGGLTRTDFGGSERGQAVALQPDGKIAVVGGLVTGSQDFFVARYTTSGGLDTTFDGDGKAVTDLGGPNEYPFGVTVQPDGKPVVTGGVRGDIGVVRYGPDGQPDPSFDDDGRAVTDAGGPDQGHALVVQSNGKLLVVGPGGSGADFLFVRYRTDGSLDQTFGTGGIATADFGKNDVPTGVAIQPDGKIVAGGWTGTVGDLALARVLRGFCRVPKLVGRPLGSARAALVTAGCSLGRVGRTYSRKIKKGRIISQSTRPAPSSTRTRP